MRGGAPLEETVPILTCIITNIPELNTLSNKKFITKGDFKGLNDVLLKNETYREALSGYNAVYGIEHNESIVTAMLRAFDYVKQTKPVYNKCLDDDTEAIRQQNLKDEKLRKKRLGSLSQADFSSSVVIANPDRFKKAEEAGAEFRELALFREEQERKRKQQADELFAKDAREREIVAQRKARAEHEGKVERNLRNSWM
jgi:hypothetical protein